MWLPHGVMRSALDCSRGPLWDHRGLTAGPVGGAGGTVVFGGPPSNRRGGPVLGLLRYEMGVRVGVRANVRVSLLQVAAGSQGISSCSPVRPPISSPISGLLVVIEDTATEAGIP